MAFSAHEYAPAWVFTQVADAGIKGGAAPGLYRPKADLVELASDRQHVFQAHTVARIDWCASRSTISNSEGFLYGSHADAPCRTWLTAAGAVLGE